MKAISHNSGVWKLTYYPDSKQDQEFIQVPFGIGFRWEVAWGHVVMPSQVRRRIMRKIWKVLRNRIELDEFQFS